MGATKKQADRVDPERREGREAGAVTKHDKAPAVPEGDWRASMKEREPRTERSEGMKEIRPFYAAFNFRLGLVVVLGFSARRPDSGTWSQGVKARTVTGNDVLPVTVRAGLVFRAGCRGGSSGDRSGPQGSRRSRAAGLGDGKPVIEELGIEVIEQSLIGLELLGGRFWFLGHGSGSKSVWYQTNKGLNIGDNLSPYNGLFLEKGTR